MPPGLHTDEEVLNWKNRVLPTFNSYAIETQIANLEGLSENLYVSSPLSPPFIHHHHLQPATCSQHLQQRRLLPTPKTLHRRLLLPPLRSRLPHARHIRRQPRRIRPLRRIRRAPPNAPLRLGPLRPLRRPAQTICRTQHKDVFETFVERSEVDVGGKSL